MTAQNQDFTMNEGETKRIDVDSTTDADTGNILDITGFQELFWVLKPYEGGEVLVKKTEANSSDVTVTDATAGAYEIVIQPSDTAGLASQDGVAMYYHKVRLTDSAGRTSDLLEGTIAIEAA